jgi:DNA modification methylase
MTKHLAHKTIVDDSCNCAVAGADYLLIFRRKGENKIPVTHSNGLMRYAGERQIPKDLMRYRGWKGNQIENRYSHWIWRQYASSVWDDIRGNTGTKAKGVLPYEESREEEDEKHLHPLQLDVIERACVLWSNPGEVVATPFMGVGSEVCGALANGRRAIGCELKPSYFAQAVKNVERVAAYGWDDILQASMFEDDPSADVETASMD